MAATCMDLTSPAPASQEKDFNGPEDDQEIESDGNVLNVKEVVGQFFLVVLDGGAITAVDLRPTSRSRLDHPALAIIGNLLQALLLLVRDEGPGSDHVH